MAHFYASVNRSMRKTEATARGSKKTGLEAHLRGWDIGVKVSLDHINGLDVVRVWRTGGSHDSTKLELLATCYERSEDIVEPPPKGMTEDERAISTIV